MQKKVSEFWGNLFVRFFPYRGEAKRLGLSERLVRERLERNGWTVWRGGFIHALRRRELFPNVKTKYATL